MGPTNLPLTGTSFHGRATRLAEVTAALANAPVVTLVGPGGVGKTRLALEVARARQASFPAGVWLVDLGPVGADRVVAEVAGPLGVATPTEAGAAAESLVVEQLGDRRLLLLLDNCEHVVDAVAGLVARLAGACPLLRVLCTSREPLGLAAEVVVPVDPLDEGAAVALFLDRARAVDPGFAASADEVDRLPSVCARLDNLPLAIELAAPWVRLASVAELPRLVGRYELTPSTRRDLPARQRTMRATALWSHDLLDATQQVLLRRLAIFPDTFDLAAVAAVVAGPPLDAGTVEEPLAQLVERSMVKVHRTGEGTRYRLLETIRDLAAERLPAVEGAALRRRHFAHCLATAERVDAERRRTGSDRAVSTLLADGAGFRAALAWAMDHDAPGAMRLATALEPYWMIRSIDEGRDWLLRALAAAPARTPDRARALVVPPLVVAGGLPWPRCRELISTAIAIFVEHDDAAGAAMARLMLALAAFMHGELREAATAVEQVRDGACDHPLVRARTAIYGGVVASFRARQPADALRSLADGAAAAAALGDTWGEGLALTLLGLAEARAARQDPARAHLTTVLRSRLQGGVTATAMVGMALLHLPKDPRRALTVLEAAVALRERTGVPAFPVSVQRVLDDAHAQAARRVAAAVARTCRDRARALSNSEAVAMACAGPAMTDPLTARQQEVAALVAGGLSNRAVAERLHLSVRTVESHVARALDTLGLADRAQLAAWAHEAGLVP